MRYDALDEPLFFHKAQKIQRDSGIIERPCDAMAVYSFHEITLWIYRFPEHDFHMVCICWIYLPSLMWLEVFDILDNFIPIFCR